MKTTMKLSTLTCVLLLGLFACTAPEPEKTAEEKAADKISEVLGNLTKDIGEAGKDVEGGVNDALSELKDVVQDIQKDKKKPINFRKLKELVPEKANGFERVKFEGESTGAMGFKVSTTKAKFEKDDKRIELEITDAGGIGSTFIGMAATWGMVDIDKESDDGFERTTKYKGYKAYEKCNRGRCEFAVFVANRFLVTTRGRNVEMDDLHDIVDDIGLRKLERMKDDEGE